jgi:hypothetical protein
MSKNIKLENSNAVNLCLVSKIKRAHFLPFCIVSFLAFGTHSCLGTVYFHNNTAKYNFEKQVKLKRLDVLSSQSKAWR